MGHGRRSRSRSRSRSKDRKNISRAHAGSSRSSGKDKGEGSSRSDARSRSQDRKGDYSSLSSSRRDNTHSTHRDRDRDRHRDDPRDRKGSSNSNSSSRRGGDRDRERGRDRDDRRRGERERDHRDDSRHRSKRSREGDSGEEDDDLWKRKSRDEDEQLKELDVDSLMVDEEEEERRLEEQRRKRKKKLEALQKRKQDEEEQKSATKQEEGTQLNGAVKAVSASSSSSLSPRKGELPQSAPSNGDPAAPPKKKALSSSSNAGYDSEDDDDDAGPIEITKLGTDCNGGEEQEENSQQGDENHDRGDGVHRDNQDGNGADEAPATAQNGNHVAVAPPARKEQQGGIITEKSVGATASATSINSPQEEGGGTSSSSDLRAQQGKEDRPVFDMFSAASLSTAAAGAGPGGKMAGKAGGHGHGMSYLGDDGGGDQGNWTDVEGYYKTRVGEVIGGRYTVLGSVGQGVFSTVLKCLDTRAGPAAVGGASEVALKMIRNNDTMRKAAQKEVALLKELAEHDPANKKHCIRLLSSLEHKQHVVMVFESMQMNLRETLKKFGRKTGINITAVQKYGKQLMAALKHMASRNLVHADIKPDNILVDQGFGSLKLADFGSAFRESDPDNDPTPYLVSRWYRAPEIVMGLDYDKAIDLWSVAVTLFELYKGSPVLPGVNNNEMLKRMMEFKGPVPTRMIKSHMRAFETMGGIRPHFTEGGQFMQQEPDPVSGQTTVRLVTITAPSRPIKGEIMRSKGAQDKKDTVVDLADFLEKCMSLDPRQRISLAQCSTHSFLRR